MAAMNTYHPGDLSGEKDKDGSDTMLPASGADMAPEEAMMGAGAPGVDDVFGREDGHDIKYKTLSWQVVALLMIAEIVSNGMLSLPSSLAAVGAVPGVIVIFFLGCFATYTSWVLIQFKLRHPEVVCILVAGILGMAGAGAVPLDKGDVAITVTTDFTTAFISITNPVFAYAGHFMFFILISEMARPQDAMKAAWALQIFCTSFYVVFALVTYYYLGSGVASPSFLSLSPIWSKISFGFAFPNFLIAGALYSHTAAKLVFVRLFRHGRHLHSHTVAGWGTWVFLIVLANGAAFVLAVGIPIFNYLVGIAASLFAAWYTYGVAGAFWIHDTYHDRGGVAGLARRPLMTSVNVLTLLAGAFICVAGLYSTIKGIQAAYADGMVQQPFAC